MPGYALLLALAVTAPLLVPGYLLLRDAVSTLRSYLSDTALGLGESAPRAVPQDFLIAAVSPVLDGGVLVKVLLIVGLFLAGWGPARLPDALVPDAGWPASWWLPRSRWESVCRGAAAAGALEPARRYGSLPGWRPR